MNSKRVARFRKLAGSEFQTDGVTKLKECSPKDFRMRSGIFKSFFLGDKRVRDVYTCRAKLKGKMGLYLGRLCSKEP